MGPMESRLPISGSTPAMDTRQALGLKPVSPHSAAGIRTEPPVPSHGGGGQLSATDTAAAGRGTAEWAGGAVQGLSGVP